MQGYFSLEFTGAKEHTNQLVEYLLAKKDEDGLHSFLFSCLGKDWDYEEKKEDEITSVYVDMSNVGGSGNVSGLDVEEIVSELCEAVPALSLSGEFHLLDSSDQQIYTSEAGSSTYTEDWAQVCSSCSEAFLKGKVAYQDDEGSLICENCYHDELAESISEENEDEDFDQLLALSIEELEQRWPECAEELGYERITI